MRMQHARHYLSKIAAPLLILLFLIGCTAESEQSIYIYFADLDRGLHLVGSENYEDLVFDEQKTDFFVSIDILYFRGSGSIQFKKNIFIQFDTQTISINGKELNLKNGISNNFIVWQDGTVALGDVIFEEPVYGQ